MGTPEKMTIERIADIYSGIETIKDNELLSATISYRIGRLSDSCRSVVRVFEKAQGKLKISTNSELEAIREGYASKTDDEKAVVNKKVREINDLFMGTIQEMLSEEDTINVPDLKMEHFTAKEDTKHWVKKEGSEKLIEINIKSGQSLVPVNFFSLLGDVIKE